MKKIILLLWIATFVLSYKSYAQDEENYNPKTVNVPTSPEAALLGRFGDVPISYYSGTANISIPLYNINVDGVSIPVQLDYHTSGIKVNDEATWVGLGWNLTPEGTIIQEVRGIIDDLDNLNYINVGEYLVFKNNFNGLFSGGFTYRNQKDYVKNLICQTGQNNMIYDSPNSEADTYSIIDRVERGMGEPDIFNFNFNGNSGSFYINPETNQIVFIKTNEFIKFEKIDQGNEKIWKATTQDGNKYYFGSKERTKSINAEDEYTGITYKLDKIITTNNKEIDFTYIDESYTSHRLSQNTALFSFENSTIDLFNVNTNIHYKKVLEKIETDELILNFNLGNRDDIENATKLNSIDIISKQTQKKVKSFIFNQNYFNSSLIGQPTLDTSNMYILNQSYTKRLKLNSLLEIGYDDNETPNYTNNPYSFKYFESQQMPSKYSCAQDFYGYFNGQNNNHFLLPDLEIFDYQNDPVYANYNPVSPTNTNQRTLLKFNYNYTSSNRYSDENYSKIFSLNEINYPTGGSTKIEYESNTFNNQFIPSVEQNNSAKKVKYLACTNWTSNFTNYQLNPTRSVIVKFSNKIFDGYTNYTSQSCTYQQMLGSEIHFYKFNTSTYQLTTIKKWNLTNVLISEFTNNHQVVWNEEVLLEYDSNPNIKYFVSVIRSSACSNTGVSPGPIVESLFSYYDLGAIDTTLSFGGGIRVASIKNYSDETTLVGNKILNYSGGKLLNKFEPLTSNFSSHVYCNSGVTSSSAIYNKISISSDDFGLDGGATIGYNKVELVEYNNDNQNKGKIVYEYFNEPNITKKGLPSIENQKNGLLIKESYLNVNNDTIMVKKNSYTNLLPPFTNSMYYGFKYNVISNMGAGNHINTAGTQFYTLDLNEDYLKKYSFSSYPIFSEWNVIKEVDTKEYFENGLISNIKKFEYNNYGKLKSELSINSLGDTIKTTYLNSIDGNYPSLVERGMIGIPMKIHKYYGNDLKSSIFTNYDLYNGLLLPSKIEVYPKEMIVNYDKYDSNGNLIQYTIQNHPPVSIIWGYNQTQPIAKIEGVLYENLPSNFVNSAITASNLLSESDLLTALNNLRVQIPNAMITTYTYKPLIGVSSITDLKGDTQYYIYDEFNRLKYVKDKIGNILSKNEYHYQLPEE